MLRYIIRRALYALPILVGVCLVTFLLFYVVVPPTQLARRNLSTRNPTPQQIHEWLHGHGYDRPLVVQFRDHMLNLALFRFGNSDANGEPIARKIQQGAGPSLRLAIPLFLTGLYVELVLALFLAYYRGTYVDLWGLLVCVFGMSVPYLVVIISGQFLLGKVLKLFPLAGFSTGAQGYKFVVLPVVVGLVSGGIWGATRFNRTAILEEINQDYVRTARAKGVPDRRILFVHVLKNAASPILTSVVMAIPFLFLGNLLLESFFGIPGLGSITVDAINSADFSMVRAMVYLGAVLYIVGSVMTDISYALVDPRVRFE
jgi:peptide/nickel transport system permease protein